MVFGREACGEPVGQPGCSPAVKLQDRLMRDVVPDPIPVEGRFAADVQPIDRALQQAQAWVQFQHVVRAAVHAARQASEPAGARIVDGQVGGDATRGQVL